MSYLVQRQYAGFGNASDQVLLEAGAIALGIILASYLAKFLRNLRIYVLRHTLWWS